MAVNFWKAFTGRAARTEQRGARAQLADLERRVGKKAAREAMGLSKAAAWRLRTGRTKQPRPATRQRIRTAHRQIMSTPGRRMRIEVSTRPGRIQGVGPRFVDGQYTVAGEYLRRGRVTFTTAAAREHLAASQDAWLAGDDASAQAELNQALSVEIGHPVEAHEGNIDWR